ncbi:MAG TPA: Mut7-C RNAse domain-containing protein [Thermoplasmata archaeon]|nr:Mut7-C RNAse domain-containing protein [Thermoplasmata archaeon]
MAELTWLADEMVGRLARYLRFVGCDTYYARGLSDDEILQQAKNEHRVIVTRDRRLAARAERALLLESPHLADQWRAVRSAFPELPLTVEFVRCTECNGLLESVRAPPAGHRPDGVPWDRVAEGLALFRCSVCGHFYWEGSHTADIRARLALWARDGGP